MALRESPHPERDPGFVPGEQSKDAKATIQSDVATAPVAVPAFAGSPVMLQYHEIKRAHPGCLLFFRMGDFYELFFAHAVAAAPALDIALTKRGRPPHRARHPDVGRAGAHRRSLSRTADPRRVQGGDLRPGRGPSRGAPARQ